MAPSYQRSQSRRRKRRQSLEAHRWLRMLLRLGARGVMFGLARGLASSPAPDRKGQAMRLTARVLATLLHSLGWLLVVLGEWLAPRRGLDPSSLSEGPRHPIAKVQEATRIGQGVVLERPPAPTPTRQPKHTPTCAYCGGHHRPDHATCRGCGAPYIPPPATHAPAMRGSWSRH